MLNQAEQLAIIKALETTESINTLDNSSRTATVFTDSRITLTLTTMLTLLRRLGKDYPHWRTLNGKYNSRG